MNYKMSSNKSVSEIFPIPRFICVCHRRIVGGVYTAFDKPYMVYFVKSNYTKPKIAGPNFGDYWLCGGAIVSPTQILTSAACLLENNNIYAIAGYRKYIKTAELDNDECTRRWKQRVVKVCTPKEYKFEYSNPMQWLSVDVGVAIVEKPYDFSDLTYRLHCSYVPAPIKILYEDVYQSEGIDVLMLGWGHLKARQPHDIKDLNSLYLREASGLIQPKSHCRTNFHTIIMEELIDKYLICVHYKGNIGGDGEILHLGELDNAGCYRRNMDQTDPRCVNDTSLYDDYDFDFRRNANQTSELDSKPQMNVSSHERLVNTRRQGICQNDHGGPLITWVGKEEVLIGVALTALLSDTYECVGPFIFTSAYCASMIIQCMLVTNVALRSACEDKTKEKEGYGIEEKTFEWGDVNSEKKSAEADFKAREVKPLHQPNLVREVPQQPTPIVHWQPNGSLRPQPNIYSKPNLPLNPQLNVHTQPKFPLRPQPIVPSQPRLVPLYPQSNVHTQPYIPLRPQPIVPTQPNFVSLDLQSNIISQPQKDKSYFSQPHVISHPLVPSAPKLNVINKMAENAYAKIKNVGF